MKVQCTPEERATILQLAQNLQERGVMPWRDYAVMLAVAALRRGRAGSTTTTEGAARDIVDSIMLVEVP